MNRLLRTSERPRTRRPLPKGNLWVAFWVRWRILQYPFDKFEDSRSESGGVSRQTGRLRFAVWQPGSPWLFGCSAIPVRFYLTERRPARCLLIPERGGFAGVSGGQSHPAFVPMPPSAIEFGSKSGSSVLDLYLPVKQAVPEPLHLGGAGSVQCSNAMFKILCELPLAPVMRHRSRGSLHLEHCERAAQDGSRLIRDIQLIHSRFDDLYLRPLGVRCGSLVRGRARGWPLLESGMTGWPRQCNTHLHLIRDI